jgi:hypothetical protein
MIKLVFDAKLWNGKDSGNNSQFWRQAEILCLDHYDEREQTATVRFLHNNRISRGHFISAMREVQ